LIVDDVSYKYTKGMHQCKAGPHRIQYEASYKQALSSSVLMYLLPLLPLHQFDLSVPVDLEAGLTHAR
jgi:hypothetical protein